VKNTEKYKLQYPFNVQVFGPFRSRLCLLYDKLHDNATILNKFKHHWYGNTIGKRIVLSLLSY
jgi:hypothetical protein